LLLQFFFCFVFLSSFAVVVTSFFVLSFKVFFWGEQASARLAKHVIGTEGTSI
jgi:hypothetical protein